MKLTSEIPVSDNLSSTVRKLIEIAERLQLEYGGMKNVKELKRDIKHR